MTCWLCGFEATELTTDAKAPTCNEGPCKICLAVSNLDEEINQAVATLRRLLAKRCDLRSEQNRVHGTLIHRLPTELKNHIFQFFVPKWSEWDSSQPSILSYISVCRNWRDIAFSNPLFWSTIDIVFRRKPPLSDPSSRINFVRDRILRSGSLPLTLDVVAHEDGCSEEEWKGLIDNLSQSSNRWRSLSLDISSRLLRSFHHGNFQCHLLKNLRIIASDGWQRDELVPLSNMSLEKIEIDGIPIQSLQISWNHLTSAKVTCLDLEELTQLFQHASQMTDCHILDAYHVKDPYFSIPSIIHHRLKTLSFVNARAAEFLGCLTLPCLQEFYAEDLSLLTYLPALVHRSSCPLSRIGLERSIMNRPESFFDNMEPLRGMTDLVLERVECSYPADIIMELLLDEYFPDLRHLTLRLDPFLFLWDYGVITELLRRLDGTTNGRRRKILVIDQHRTDEAHNIGQQLKALGLDVSLAEDGFEILMPCVNIDLLVSHLPLRLAVR